MRARFTSFSLALILFLLAGAASAQGVVVASAFERGATTYVEVAALARAMGVVAHADGNVLTWRGTNGPATLFASSADALMHFPGDAGPTDVALAAPVLVVTGAWYVPLDTLPLFGIEVPPFGGRLERLPLGSGRELVLDYVSVEAETRSPSTIDAPGNASDADAGQTDPRPGAPTPGTTGRASWEPAEAPLAGVRFFDGDGVSLLLVDLALVPLAQPGLTGDVDRAMDRAQEAGSDHVLLMMVTAVADLAWSPVLVFEQDGRRMEVRTPYRMLLETGDESSVGPGSPVLGAVLLPPSFSLYREMRVEWAGAQAVVRFRK